MIKIKCETKDVLDFSAITDFQGNLKARDDADFEKIERSIKKHGFSFPFFIWKKGKINYCLDGHGRLGALQRLVAEGENIPPLPVVYVKCKDENEAKEILLKLNSQYGRMTAESVKEFLGDLKIDFEDLALPDGFLELSTDDAMKDTKGDDDAPEVDYGEPDSKPGTVYQLGPHRLMCGDSTSVQDMEKLMDGEKADLIITDPPYNVDYEGGNGKKIQNDNMSDNKFLNFLTDAFRTMLGALKNGGAFYIWHADSEGYNFRQAVKNCNGEIRQCLIWVKNSLVLGRQDYQWRHEPCQPAGTKVLTTEGEKNIEDLTEQDRVISFDTYSGQIKGYKNGGYAIKTASRDYKGLLYSVYVAKNRVTRATNNHQFSVRFNQDTVEKYCTYLMKRGNWWRVGITRTYDARGFGLKHRYEQEHAEKAWIIETFPTMADAQMGEQYLACKYGIPYTHWETDRGIVNNPYNTRTQEQIKWIYDHMDLEAMRLHAHELLTDYGRDPEYPLVCEGNKRQKYSRRVTARIEACNLIPGLMELPVPGKPADSPNFKWVPIQMVTAEKFSGKVYSLAVEKYEHYIADGIVTHNCLYGWKAGAGHYWEGRRDLSTVFDETRGDWPKMSKDQLIAELKRYDQEVKTTIIYEDKPKKSDEHPTMKPVRLFERLMLNSSKAEDIVLDPFGGSGTTVITAAKTGRIARTMELDPRYCDVIRKRWTTWAKENGLEPGPGGLE